MIEERFPDRNNLGETNPVTLFDESKEVMVR